MTLRFLHTERIILLAYLLRYLQLDFLKLPEWFICQILKKLVTQRAVAGLQRKFPGLKAEKAGDGWHIVIPDKCRVGHEAHFRNVMEAYLQYLAEGRLPEWEVPNMIAKYYITTRSLELAQRGE